MTTNRDTVENWKRLLSALQKGSFVAAAMFERRQRLLGLPAMVLSTIVGTAIFASLAQTQTPTEPWIKIVTGLVSVAAAVLSSLQTFLGYAELAQKHKTAGLKYGALRRETEEALAFESEAELASRDFFKSIRTRWDQIDQEAPPLPQQIYDKVIAEFKTSG
jgi:hypothetical protein